nr:MAG TPA: hypothetical protein [Caudoviricetes sp.]DAP50990.1 MAG TPA: hypothetical protein [Caudoviricetes sp.]
MKEKVPFSLGEYQRFFAAAHLRQAIVYTEFIAQTACYYLRLE